MSTEARKIQLREAQRRRRQKLKNAIPVGHRECTKCGTGIFRPIAEFSFGYKTCDRHHSKPKPAPKLTVDDILGNPPAVETPPKIETPVVESSHSELKPPHKIRYFVAYRTWYMKELGLNPKRDRTPAQVSKSWDKYKNDST